MLVTVVCAWALAGAQAVFAAKDTVHIPLRYVDQMYLVESVAVAGSGKPLQNVLLDTGSSDLVLGQNVWPGNGNDSQNHTSGGSGSGNNTEVYESQYGSSGPLELTEVTTSLSGSGWTLARAIAGVANESEIDGFWGVFGIGYRTTEAMGSYDNFPIEAKKQGLVARNAYALDGNPVGPSILFGGIDTSAYSGTLVKTQINYEVGPTQARSYITAIVVTVNDVVAVSGSQKIPLSQERLIYTLDSACNGWVVPQRVYNNLISALGGSSFESNDTAFFEHDALSQVSLTFNITGVEVHVPLTDLFDQYTARNGSVYVSLLLSTVDIGENSYEGTLPNAVFKYMYTVFDLDDNHVFFASLRPYMQREGAAVSALSGRSYPVPTTLASAYHSSYTKMYTESQDISVSTSFAWNSTSTSHTPPLSTSIA
ncbi:Piso0_000831 [Millerozyma farinosa CBS 7064]|uniref:Piso0_000831 protein n=1 Tax=Pichia sorbitophila (strain ATCC MYA-4447 / BCRC 22081 / CBS 7064 / NBRC 10061 / NRRL Y-12695) TaxID=559304 RepID=G8YQ67_PICSO|nr:Piso0_000831 [Millerozyma farinosa CBS 7064]